MSEFIQANKMLKYRGINPLFIPLMILLGIVPAIVRMKVVDAEDILYETFKTTEFVDFYSQYKASFIIALTVTMLIVFFIFSNEKIIKRDKNILFYTLAASAFGGLTILSSMLSKYKSTAIWGVPDRAEGMVVICCYIIIFLYTIHAYTREDDYKYILYGLSIMIIINTLLGFTQYIGKDFLLSDLGKKILIPDEFAHVRSQLVTQFEKGKLTGTLFNPNYMGSFTAMTIPMFAIFAIISEEISKKIIFAIMTVCSLFLLFGSGSRAGIVALGIIIALALIIYGKKVWASKTVVFSAIGLFVVLAGIAGVVTKGTIFQQLKNLSIDAAALFMPGDKSFDYRDYIPLRDLFIEEGKAVIVTQDDRLIIQNTPEGIQFYDEHGKPVSYVFEKPIYRFGDERFNKIILNQHMRVDDPNQVGGASLIVDGEPMFLLKIENDGGLELVDPFTQMVTKLQHPIAIGFRGKERLGSARGYIWSRSIPMLKDTLILGNGPDTFPIEFPQNDYLGKLYAYGNVGMIVDKPHNMYLQIGINQGILALLIFLSVMAFYIINSFKLYALRLSYTKSQTIGIAIMFAVVGYLVAGMFNDSAVSVAPVFWILFGMGIAVNYIENQKNNHVE